MKRAFYFAILSLSAGCAAFVADTLNDMVMHHARYDLACQPENVAVTTVVTNERFDAVGCGKKATYLYEARLGDVLLNEPVKSIEEKKP